jgi:uncharacterized membrane protein SpoIIM required for sporulation
MGNVSNILKAWQRLLAIFLVALCYGYFGGLVLIFLFGVDPFQLFGLSTVGLQHVGAPVMAKSIEFHIDPAIVIFAFNTLVTFAIASLLVSATLLNPDRMGELPANLRKSFLRDPTINLFYPMQAFRAIRQRQLRPVFVWLRVIPAAPLLALGLMAGGMMASAHAVIGSLEYVAALLIPHGIFEVSAILLGAALPSSAYLLIKKDLEAGATEKAFGKIARFSRSRAIKASMLAIVLLLAVASVIEAHLTGTIAAWVRSF